MQEALKSRYAAVIPSLTCCCAALRLQGGLRNALLWFMVLTAALPGTHGQNRRERDSDREDWFLIEFDGTPAGYEVVSERSVAAKSRVGSCAPTPNDAANTSAGTGSLADDRLAHSHHG